jgi:hypothetical protein
VISENRESFEFINLLLDNSSQIKDEPNVKEGAIICLREELGALDGDTLIVGAHLV